MSWGRPLLTALFLCSLPAFTQENSPITKNDSRVQQAPDLRAPAVATPGEPWRILPKADSDKDHIEMTPLVDSDGTLLLPGGPATAENTCFAIRSYVVARDSKDSDSVHPVRYTTCVPAAKYQLKTADARVVLTH